MVFQEADASSSMCQVRKVSVLPALGTIAIRKGLGALVFRSSHQRVQVDGKILKFCNLLGTLP